MEEKKNIKLGTLKTPQWLRFQIEYHLVESVLLSVLWMGKLIILLK